MISDPTRWALQTAPVDDPTARHVLLVLACHAKPDGSDARPSDAAIVAETGYHRATVIRARQLLERDGLIIRDGTFRRSIVWQLALWRTVAERDMSQSATSRTARQDPVAERDTERPLNTNGNNPTHRKAVEGPPWAHPPAAVPGDRR